MAAAARRSSLLSALAIAVVLTLVPASGARAAASGTFDDEAGFVSRINADRTATGLPTLAVASDLTAVARRHAQRMADAGQHFHNSNLQNEVSGWRMLGENVGRGTTVDGLHQAFMGSPAHRANILKREFTQVGLGVARDAGGRIYVVEVFRQPVSSSAPAPAPAPAPQPAPTPAPAPPPPPAPTTTTTAAPAPTTTVPPAAEPVARPLVQTAETVGASAAGGETALARVELPTAAGARSVAGPATLAAALIVGLVLALAASHRGGLLDV